MQDTTQTFEHVCIHVFLQVCIQPSIHWLVQVFSQLYVQLLSHELHVPAADFPQVKVQDCTHIELQPAQYPLFDTATMQLPVQSFPQALLHVSTQLLAQASPHALAQAFWQVELHVP